MDRAVCFGVECVRAAQQITIDQVGADIALEQVDFLGQVQGAVGGQVRAVVHHDVGVLHQVVLQMQGGRVQPWNPGIDEKSSHGLVNAHQVQRVGDDLGLLPVGHFVEFGWHVLAVVQNTNQGLVDQAGLRLKTLLLAILVQG